MPSTSLSTSDKIFLHISSIPVLINPGQRGSNHLWSYVDINEIGIDANERAIPLLISSWYLYHSHTFLHCPRRTRTYMRVIFLKSTFKLFEWVKVELASPGKWTDIYIINTVHNCSLFFVLEYNYPSYTSAFQLGRVSQ